VEKRLWIKSGRSALSTDGVLLHNFIFGMTN
jgi:hypothetical protein